MLVSFCRKHLVEALTSNNRAVSSLCHINALLQRIATTEWTNDAIVVDNNNPGEIC